MIKWHCYTGQLALVTFPPKFDWHYWKGYSSLLVLGQELVELTTGSGLWRWREQSDCFHSISVFLIYQWAEWVELMTGQGNWKFVLLQSGCANRLG